MAINIPTGHGMVTFGYEGVNIPNGAVNTLGFLNTAGDSAALAAEAMFLRWASNVMPNLSSGIALTSALVKLGPEDTGPSAVYTDSAPGGASADSAAPNTAWLVKKSTAGGGRRARGRMYIPGVTEAAMLSDGSTNATIRGALQDDLEQFFLDCVTGDQPLELIHSDAVDANGDPIPNTAPAPTLLTALTVDTFLATQRRRLR